MFNLQKLLPRHYKVIDLCLDGILSIKDIAAELNMTTAAIRNIRNSPTFQHELSLRKKVRDDMHDELAVRTVIDATDDLIKNNTEAAAEVIVGLLTCTDKAVALKGATEILDRGGYPRAAKLEQDVKTAVVVLDRDDVRRIERTRELDKE